MAANFLAPLIAPLTNYPQLGLGGLLTTRTDIKTEFVLNALPNQTGQRIYKGRMYIKKKILFVIDATTTIFDKSFPAPANYLPIDNNSGGILDISKLAGKLPFELKNDRFSFVPTFSSLDIGGGLQPITLNEVTQGYSNSFPPQIPKNVVAQNFFSNPSEAGKANEIHTQVTLRNGRWLFQEIVGTPQIFGCSYLCTTGSLETKISGASIICNSQAYKINSLPSGTTASWSSSWNSPPYPQMVLNSPYLNELTINNTYKYPSITTLNASVNGNCGVKVFTKQLMSESNTQVQYGTYYQEACYFYNVYHPSQSGSLPTTLSTPVFLHQGCMTEITLSGMVGKTVTFSGSIQPLYWSYNSSTSILYLQLPYGSGGIPFAFKINGEGACYEKSILFFSYSNNSSYSFAAAPNPVSDELTIYSQPSDETITLKGYELAISDLEFTASIYDVATNVLMLRQKRTKDGSSEFKLNVSKLRPGPYILQILQGDDLQTFRIQKGIIEKSKFPLNTESQWDSTFF